MQTIYKNIKNYILKRGKEKIVNRKASQSLNPASCSVSESCLVVSTVWDMILEDKLD
jgi:hypothetical protein